MPRLPNVSHRVAISLLLGTAALVANFSLSYFSTVSIRFGDLFLFLAACSLGVSSSLVAVAVGVIPEVLLNDHYAHFIRLLILCPALAYASERFPRFPAFLVAALMWAVVFTPASYALPSALIAPLLFVPSVGDQSARLVHITFYGFTEVLLVLVAGALLHNRSIYGLFTQRPRRVSMASLLMHVSTLLTMTTSLIALRVLGAQAESSHLALLQDHPIGFMVLIAVALVAPALLGNRLARVIQDHQREFLDSTILETSGQGSFSGRSSEYWKRRTSVDTIGERYDSMTTVDGTPDKDEESDEDSKHPELKDKGICAVNRDGTITFANRKFLAYAEVKANEVIGRRLDAVGMNPELCSHITSLIETTFLKGPRITELRVNEHPHTLRFFEVGTVVCDTVPSTISGGPDSLIVTVRDITDRRTVESRLLQAQKLDSLGKLLAGVTHSFANSLTTIVGHASIARRVEDPTRRNRSLDEILAAADRAGNLARQLVDFAGEEPGFMKEANLSTLVQARLELLRKLVGDGAELVYRTCDELLGVKCEPNLFTQALTNLVANASESYGKKGGKIEISLDREEIHDDISHLHLGARPGTFARLRVRDWGCGMSQETLAKAFDPLFTTKASKGHPGLGLSIVFAMVRAHDGFLTAESRIEKGTTISLYLPLQSGAQTRAISEERKASAAVA